MIAGHLHQVEGFPIKMAKFSLKYLFLKDMKTIPKCFLLRMTKMEMNTNLIESITDRPLFPNSSLSQSLEISYHV